MVRVSGAPQEVSHKEMAAHRRILVRDDAFVSATEHTSWLRLVLAKTLAVFLGGSQENEEARGSRCQRLHSTSRHGKIDRFSKERRGKPLLVMILDSRVGCVLGLLVAMAGSSGCKTSGPLLLPDGGFRHPEYPLQVGYGTSAPGEVLGPHWQLENFQYKNGVAKKPKRSRDYTVEYALDRNDDGKPDLTETWPAVDLRYVHDTTRAVIWLETFPVSSRLAETEPRVLAKGIVDGLSGEVTRTAAYARQRGVELRSEGRTVTTFVRQESTCMMGDDEAYSMEFEIADVDQIKLDPERRIRIARLIVIRTGLTWGRPRSTARFPVMMVVGYSARPEDYPTFTPDFEMFLADIGVGQEGSETPPEMPSGFTCSAPVENTPTPGPASAEPAEQGDGTPPPSETADTPPGCRNDMDCKGDRICTNGACVSPTASPSSCSNDADCGEGQACREGTCSEAENEGD